MGEQSESPLGQLKHLPYGDLYKAPTSHSAEELDSIRHLKVWGNAEMPHPNRAYLLVQVNDTPDMPKPMVWLWHG